MRAAASDGGTGVIMRQGVGFSARNCAPASAGNDTIVVTATNQVGSTDLFDGGADTDTIQTGPAATGTSIDLSAAASDGVNGFLNIEGIAFANASGTSTATFSSSQFGPGKISNALTITGSAGTNALVINLAP